MITSVLSLCALICVMNVITTKLNESFEAQSFTLGTIRDQGTYSSRVMKVFPGSPAFHPTSTYIWNHVKQAAVLIDHLFPIQIKFNNFLDHDHAGKHQGTQNPHHLLTNI